MVVPVHRDPAGLPQHGRLARERRFPRRRGACILRKKEKKKKKKSVLANQKKETPEGDHDSSSALFLRAHCLPRVCLVLCRTPNSGQIRCPTAPWSINAGVSCVLGVRGGFSPEHARCKVTYVGCLQEQYADFNPVFLVHTCHFWGPALDLAFRSLSSLGTSSNSAASVTKGTSLSSLSFASEYLSSLVQLPRRLLSGCYDICYGCMGRPR